MELISKDYKFALNQVDLSFEALYIENIFALRKDITVDERLEHNKYIKYKSTIEKKYPHFLGRKIGDFLLELKNSGDPYYHNFLNCHGDKRYCRFKFINEELFKRRGLYFFTIGDNISDVKYIGRCLDNFNKRINIGYGDLDPENCYKKGQSTNCRLNNLILEHKDVIRLFLVPLDEDDDYIKTAETELKSFLRIKLGLKLWNIR